MWRLASGLVAINPVGIIITGLAPTDLGCAVLDCNGDGLDDFIGEPLYPAEAKEEEICN